jgi:hypothetical protein
MRRIALFTLLVGAALTADLALRLAVARPGLAESEALAGARAQGRRAYARPQAL